MLFVVSDEEKILGGKDCSETQWEFSAGLLSKDALWRSLVIGIAISIAVKRRVDRESRAFLGKRFKVTTAPGGGSDG